MLTQEKILLLVIGVLLFGSTQAMAQSPGEHNISAVSSVSKQKQNLAVPPLMLREAKPTILSTPGLSSFDAPVTKAGNSVSAPNWAGLDTARNSLNGGMPTAPAVA